jgi:ketosteroid isomerase-like protein
MRDLAILLVAPVLAFSCAAGPSVEDFERELLDADREFLRETIDRGLEGWSSFFTEDALRVDLHGETVVGLEAIRAADAALFEPGGLRLRWEPREAVAFDTRTSGMTRGRYELIREQPGADGRPEVVGAGSYMTLWRRENGRLKVYLDTGAPDPPSGKLLD